MNNFDILISGDVASTQDFDNLDTLTLMEFLSNVQGNVLIYGLERGPQFCDDMVALQVAHHRPFHVIPKRIITGLVDSKYAEFAEIRRDYKGCPPGLYKMGFIRRYRRHTLTLP